MVSTALERGEGEGGREGGREGGGEGGDRVICCEIYNL